MRTHSTETHREIAENGQILQVLVGSGVHGVTVDGQDDEDLMGICIEPPEYVIGIKGVFNGKGISPFEQYVFRTQPEGVRSGHGDIDLTIYSLRKWMQLATAGNPSILLPLFVPDEEIRYINEIGEELRDLSPRILSKKAGHRYLGYLQAQRGRLEGTEGNKHTNRRELVEQFGYDTKFAYHMVRLGAQGIELLTTGKVTLPIEPHLRQTLLEIRNGKFSKEETLEMAADFEQMLKKLVADDGPELGVRDEPDYDYLNDWLIESYNLMWVDQQLKVHGSGSLL